VFPCVYHAHFNYFENAERILQELRRIPFLVRLARHRYERNFCRFNSGVSHCPPLSPSSFQPSIALPCSTAPSARSSIRPGATLSWSWLTMPPRMALPIFRSLNPPTSGFVTSGFPKTGGYPLPAMPGFVQRAPPGLLS